MPIPISGAQFHLSCGPYEAIIASVGASLRSLEHQGRPLVVPFEADEPRPAFRGAILAPWPNRIVDGRYEFAGVEQQLPVTEPERNQALHGLAAWLNFTPKQVSKNRVELVGSIEAQAGYPHRVEVAASYTLTESGLHAKITGTNTGTTSAPWGASAHPYLVAGAGKVDDWVLTLPASSVMTVTEDRLIPTGTQDVATEMEGYYDFRRPRRLADTSIDHAFSALQRDNNGLVTVTLRAADGLGVSMRWDRACPWVQIHTADTLDARTTRSGLAVEPMTCPPNAFNSGTDLSILEPGASTSSSWTVCALQRMGSIL